MGNYAVAPGYEPGTLQQLQNGRFLQLYAELNMVVSDALLLLPICFIY
jgi:hypothetical protein